jgi:hypothetical protein
MKRMDAPRRRARAWWLPLLATVAVTVTACSTTTDVPSPQASGSPAAAVRAHRRRKRPVSPAGISRRATLVASSAGEKGGPT